MPGKMALLKKPGVLEIMTLLMSIGAPLTTATIKFFDEPYKPRVYRGAPADTAVLTVNACRYVSQGCTPDPVTYTLGGGSDASLFRVDSQTALIQTADVVVQPLGHIFRLLIYAAYSSDGQNVVESRQVLVEVSEENRFGPIFEEDLYTLWAFRYWPPGTVAGQVSAKDADTQIYNRQITYSMTTSTGNSQFLFLNPDTGEISVAYPLPDPRLTPVVQLAVAATNVKSSPVRSAITKVDVRISRLDAPAWLYAQEVTATSVYLCWERVQEPGVTTIGYNITWTDLSSALTSVITVYIRGAHSDPMCGQISALKTWNNYTAVVHAWNNKERGPESPRLNFTPSLDGCVPGLCTAGACERQASPPGYRCVCPPGYSGPRCESFNPCDTRPCQNLGACTYKPTNDYTCSCVLGYYGKNCSYLNRCSLDPCKNGAICVNTSVIGDIRCDCSIGFSGGLCEINEPCQTEPCRNGGTCYIDNSPANSRGFVCSCVAGYHGQDCETFNPCTSSPCADGGSCRALNDTDYECLCRPGFYGPRCQSLNPCISNPCQHGAECRNFSESFFCECGQGPTCSTVTNECVSDPCENGGNCRDLPSGFACDCQAGFFGPLCATVGSCPDETVQDPDYGQFVWETVGHSTTARLPCPLGPLNAQATRPCRLDALTNTVAWLPPDFSACRRIGRVRAERLAAEMESLTNEQENLDPTNLASVADALEQIVQYTKKDDQLVGSAVRILSNTMAANDTAMMTSNKQNQTARRLVKVVDRLLTNVAVSSNQDLSLTTPNLALKIVALQNESSGQPVVIPTSEQDVSVTVSLPGSEIFRKVSPSEQRAPPRAQFAVYSKDVFFLQEGGAAKEKRTVVAATVTQTELRDLRDPVVIAIPRSQLRGSDEEQCAYWNVTTGRWALNGVFKNEEASSNSQTVCLAYHLTSFALVTDADVLSAEVRREILLTSPSYIGCAVAIFFSFLTLFTYVLFRSVRSDRSGKVVIQLTVSLLLLNILFVLVSMPGVHASAAACVGAMFFMQAFVLTAFTWLLLDAHNLYHILLTVFISYDSKFMLKRIAVAWGVPLLYVGFLVILDLTTYERGEDYCYAPKQNSMVYYVGVMALMILLWVITVLMWMVVARVSQRPFAGDKPLAGDPRLKQGQIQASGAIVLLMLLTWLFGLLALRSRMLPLEIIFCLANICLSVLLFISKCVTYSEAKASWIQLVRDGTLRRSRGSPASVASEDSGESESPIVLGRGLGRTGSRFGDVFASNSIITQNNVWSTGSQGKPLSPPQQSRTSGSKKYNSLRYGRTNVHFADFLEQQQQDEDVQRTYVTPPTRRLGDNHVTEL